MARESDTLPSSCRAMMGLVLAVCCGGLAGAAYYEPNISPVGLVVMIFLSVIIGVGSLAMLAGATSECCHPFVNNHVEMR